MAATYDGLYTLRAAPSLVERETVDLFPCDSAGQPLHRPEIEEADPPAAYALSMHHEKPGIMSLVDPLSGSILCSTITISQNRMRCMQLHNPSANVELKNKTLMSFEWAFRWEDMRFAWQRDRETISTRNSGLDYNLDRLTLEDRKGFEIVLLSSLYSIIWSDKLDESINSVPSTSQQRKVGVGLAPVLQQLDSARSRSPSPNAAADAVRPEEISENEILITMQLSETAYVEHCLALFQDPNLIFITILAANADTVTRAISIASEVKRRRSKNNEEDLLQFLDFPGRSRRGSNSTPQDRAPPTEIKIFLSRIPLEEFVPDSISTKMDGRSKSTNKVTKPPLPPKTTTKSLVGRR
ncbi:hypothetical protein EMMF5_000599 [Cystobasidiomycetes sp. EMM_F5]